MPVIELAPPQDLTAEESVLGAIMLSGKMIEPCSEILTGGEFFRASNGVIFRACVNLWERNSPVDPITVVSELTQTGMLEAANGEERVNEIASQAVSSGNAGHYAKIVREAWLRRELSAVGMETYRQAMEGGAAEQLIADADKRVMELSAQLLRKQDSVFTAKELVSEFRERMKHQVDESKGIPAPFPRLLRPFQGSRLYVLGGYQGDGKSALAVQAIRSACEAGKRAAFASIEMKRGDLVDRLVSTFGVPHSFIMDRNIGGYEELVEDALGQINEWDFSIIDDQELDPSAIRRYQRQNKWDFLVVDHLQRVLIKDKRHEREEIAENVRRFTNLACEFDIPVLLLSQLARGPKHDPFPRPTMASGAGTSAIESEAAMVFFVWRVRKDGNRQNETELLIEKNRFGPEGWIHLNFRPSYVRFDEATYQTEGMAP